VAERASVGSAELGGRLRSIFASLIVFAAYWGVASAQPDGDTPFEGIESEQEIFESAVPNLSLRAARYGAERWQTLSYVSPSRSAPVVFRVPSAGFAAGSANFNARYLKTFFFDNGFAYVEFHGNSATRRDMGRKAEETAAAIREIVRNPAKYGVDASRIVLLGQGSQAHLAALLATDDRYLTAAGAPFDAIQAVISIGGEGFDIPARMATASPWRVRRYRRVFGDDAANQHRLSPAAHLARPNAENFLFYVFERDSEITSETRRFAAALEAAGAEVDVRSLPESRPQSLRTVLGAPQHPETNALLAFIREAVAR
jgi:arylformamidase